MERLSLLNNRVTFQNHLPSRKSLQTILTYLFLYSQYNSGQSLETICKRLITKMKLKKRKAYQRV